MTTDALRPLVGTLKALAHPARLRILALLREGELCVCEVAEVLGLAPSTVSEHLTALRRIGLVREWKEGRWVHVALAEAGEGLPLLACLWPLMAGAEAALAQDREQARHLRAQGCPSPCDAPCSPASQEHP